MKKGKLPNWAKEEVTDREWAILSPFIDNFDEIMDRCEEAEKREKAKGNP